MEVYVDSIEFIWINRLTMRWAAVCAIFFASVICWVVPALQSEQDQEESEGEDSAVIMDRLCKFIYAKDRTDRIRTCAILCHIYHHALHSRWYQARDLMLMSHLQDNIHHADPPVQVGRQAGRHKATQKNNSEPYINTKYLFSLI